MKNHEKTYRHTLRQLSDRIVSAQQALRILDSIKWDIEIQNKFFSKKCKELPDVNSEYYQKNKFSFDFSKKQEEFQLLERDINREVGQFSSVGSIMLRMCREYRDVLRLLKARGTVEFSAISQELYGSAEDAFYVNAPRLKDLAKVVSDALNNIKDKTENALDIKKYTSEQAEAMLNQRLANYFVSEKKTNAVKRWVKLSDGIVADAAAGSEWIKIRKNTLFSERDLKILEVHEGWVHMGSTLNGLQQPICTFLSKGPPSATVTQEGLAITMEIFHFVSSPLRIKKLTDRVTAIAMAEEGADFLEVFNFFLAQDHTEEDSYKSSVRIFRGSLPDKGPFTKDLVYSKGFILIYNYLRLAVQEGLVDRIPLLFVGKTSLEDQRLLSHLLDEGLIVAPYYVPHQFKDLAALSCWMCYSLFLNKLNLDMIAVDYRNILEG
ncbi:MAG: flavohemoglobin expression-modulating QEGLA motif protein [Rickettsiella sp.]|nr:flavohemoglobin expression-modulating QEGLA motif protein [Rickettsiella sp.]